MQYHFHFSPTGGTRKVGCILANALGGSWEERDLTAPVEALTLSQEDLVILSMPSYGGRVPAGSLKELDKVCGSGAKVILVCVYGNRAWEDTLTEMQDAIEARGLRCVAAVAAVAEHSLFRRYAAGRPDAEDAAELTAFAGKIRAKLERGELSVPALEGAHGTYKTFGGVPFKPQGSELCKTCGLCAAKCPAGAIDPAAPNVTDESKCISCMRCVAICPSHARDLDAAVMDAAAEARAAILGGRKENHLYL